MHLRFAAPLFSVLLFAATGCDLVSDPDGPRPEDFEVQSDTAEAQTGEELDVYQGELRQDMASPLSTARGGVTLSIVAPQR